LLEDVTVFFCNTAVDKIYDNLRNYILNSARTPQQFSANLTSSYGNEYDKVDFALSIGEFNEIGANLMEILQS